MNGGILRKLMKKEKVILYILLFFALIDLGIMFLQTAYIQSYMEAFVLSIGPIALIVASEKMYSYEGEEQCQV